MDLVPIKVKIGLRPNGHADHPDWSKLQPALGGDDPETHMFYGWRYDKTSGHKEHTVDSSIGFQYGVKLVTAALATAALVQWPSLITVLNETELAAFWDDKANAGISATRRNVQALEGLKVERDLRVALALSTTTIDAEIADALDPDKDDPGLTIDHMARWSTAKVRLDIKIVGP